MNDYLNKKEAIFLKNGHEIIFWDNNYLPIIYFHTVKNPPVLSHYHNSVEINCVLKGDPTFIVAGINKKLHSGNINISNSLVVHHIEPDNSLSEDDGVISITIQFNLEYILNFIPEYKSHYFFIPNEDVEKEIYQLIYSYFERNYVLNCETQLKINTLELTFKLLKILAEKCLLNKEEVPTEIVSANEKVKAVIDYINLNYQENIQSSDVAKEFNFTREYFSRFFKNQTGLTFKQYIMRYRLERSLSQLRDSKIVDVALNNGFNSENQYITWFKKTYTTTPAKFKKEL